MKLSPFNSPIKPLRLFLCIFLLLGGHFYAQAQLAPSQPGLGRDYIGNSNLDGLVVDIETVESENYIGTVARVDYVASNPANDRNYLLVRTRLKANGYERFKVIDLGRLAGVSHDLLSIELSNDEDHIVIATSYQNGGLESVLLLKVSFSGITIVDQDEITHNALVMSDYNGIEIQRRFNASGDGVGYTLAIGGAPSGNLSIAVSELSETFYPNISAVLPIQATLTGSDSNDEFMLMCGNSRVNGRVKAFRYNCGTHSFDFAREYSVLGTRLGPPLIAYNINSATGNRNGFFVGADEFNSLGSIQRPLVFHARNNGTIVWNRVLEEGTEFRGMFHTGSLCQVMTTGLTAAALQDEYKKYALTASSGTLNAGESFTAAIGKYYNLGVKLQKGFQGRAILIGASTHQPSDWTLNKANAAGLLSVAGFPCAGSEAFPVLTRSVFSNEVDFSTIPTNVSRTDPEVVGVLENSSNFPCHTNKRSAEETEMAHAILESARVYPNPTTTQIGSFTLEVSSQQDQKGDLLLTDMLGRTVHQAHLHLQEGVNQVLVQPHAVSQGVYLLQLEVEGHQVLQERLVFH